MKPPERFAARDHRLQWVLVLMLVTSVTALAEEPQHCAVPGFKGVLVAGAGLYVGAMQDLEQLEKLPSLGVRLVIDLRPDDADGTDGGAVLPESMLAEKAGLAYRRLAVRGKEDLTLEKAKALDAVLREAKGEPVLVHCTTGNRAAALLALRDALVLGKTREASLSFMRRSGLVKLEPTVSAVLDKKGR